MTASQTVDDFIAYVRSFDPEFTARIEGATREEIDALERAAGVPLPRDYRRFLELMGRKDDSILGSDDIATSADSMLAFYEDVRRGEESVPDGCVVLAISGLSIEQLNVDATDGSVHQWIVDQRRPWADSLAGLLFRMAFIRSLERRYRRFTHFSGSGALAASEGDEWRRRWFSDGVTACYESAASAVAVSRYPDVEPFVYIATNGSLFALWKLRRQWRRG